MQQFIKKKFKLKSYQNIFFNLRNHLSIHLSKNSKNIYFVLLWFVGLMKYKLFS